MVQFILLLSHTLLFHYSLLVFGLIFLLAFPRPLLFENNSSRSLELSCSNGGRRQPNNGNLIMLVLVLALLLLGRFDFSFGRAFFLKVFCNHFVR